MHQCRMWHADAALDIAAALEHASHSALGRDAGLIAGIGEIGVPLSATPKTKVDALIDFSVPEATDAVIELCVSQDVALVMATTGLSEAQQEKLHKATESIAVVWAPNMSLAVNLTMKLATIAAAFTW